MNKMIAWGAVFFSATALLAQTKKSAQSPESRSSAVKMTPMNVKTGLWQNTSTISVIGGIGLPPELLAKLTPEQKAKYEAALQAQNQGHTSTTTHQGCLTEKDLTTAPFEQSDPDKNLQCKGTLLSSTRSDIEVQETCSGEVSMLYTLKIHAIDREHAEGTGKGTVSMGGHTMKSSVKFEAKWLGATCPAGVN